IAFRLHGKWVSHYEYDIDGSPCGHALEVRDMVFYPDRVLDLFPGEKGLRGMGAVSYIGAPILDHDGNAILGHVGALGVKPMPETDSYRQIFRLFTAR